MIYCESCGSQVSGNYCENCGDSVTQSISQYQRSEQSTARQLVKRKYNLTTITIASIIFDVVLVLVLIALLYYNTDNDDWTPTDSMYCIEEGYPPDYYFVFQDSVDYHIIEIHVYDASGGGLIILQPDTETYKQNQDGLTLTYRDANTNGNLDGPDVLYLQGGESGDRVTIVNKLTLKIIATITIN